MTLPLSTWTIDNRKIFADSKFYLVAIEDSQILISDFIAFWILWISAYLKIYRSKYCQKH